MSYLVIPQTLVKIPQLTTVFMFFFSSVSIRMLKISGDTICKSLEIIFKQAPTTSASPSDWKKGNIVPCYKKGDKQNLKNYHSVSLLPICRKIFERLIFNEMFIFFSD